MPRLMIHDELDLHADPPADHIKHNNINIEGSSLVLLINRLEASEHT